MIVSQDEMCGSIGGGGDETRLAEAAKRKTENGKWKINAKIVEQVHRKNSPDASGMICSGRQTVLFFELNFHHLETVRGNDRRARKLSAENIKNLESEI